MFYLQKIYELEEKIKIFEQDKKLNITNNKFITPKSILQNSSALTNSQKNDFTINIITNSPNYPGRKLNFNSTSENKHNNQNICKNNKNIMKNSKVNKDNEQTNTFSTQDNGNKFKFTNSNKNISKKPEKKKVNFLDQQENKKQEIEKEDPQIASLNNSFNNDLVLSVNDSIFDTKKQEVCNEKSNDKPDYVKSIEIYQSQCTQRFGILNFNSSTKKSSSKPEFPVNKKRKLYDPKSNDFENYFQ